MVRRSVERVVFATRCLSKEVMPKNKYKGCFMDLERRAISLYESCRKLAPINPNYANMPIEEGFDWSSQLSDASFSGLYLVVFRSVRRITADTALLKEHDDRAYEEAVRSGGLLRYFKGQLNDRRECLSFCLWESRGQAREAVSGSSHQAAAEISTGMYEVYDLERYLLSKAAGGGINFQPLAAEHVRISSAT